jgi:hypothetical protein
MKSAAVVLVASLVLTQDRPNQQGAATNTPAEPAPTSYQLIDRALAAKRIDAETAHKYRVFAAFGDTRLPAQFAGSNTAPEPPLSVERAGALLETFSPGTRAELAPFFMRPNEPGSWVSLATVPGQGDAPETGSSTGGRGFFGGLTGRARDIRLTRFSGGSLRGRGSAGDIAERGRLAMTKTAQGGWTSYPAAGGKARVWAQNRYPADDAKAQGLATALTTHIWDKLNDLMDPEPASDANFPNNGGDGALDFYLVHAPPRVTAAGTVVKWEGQARTAVPADPCHAARYIVIDSRRPLGTPTTPGVIHVAAHELMHAITFAYRVADNGGCGDPWIVEASATWAGNFVYPRVDDEHTYAMSYLTGPHTPIDHVTDGDTHHYGAYLFPLFQEMSGAAAAFMPAVWAKLRTMQSLAGVNSVLAGGWEKVWPQFLIKNLNEPPVDAPNGHRSWDRLGHKALVRRHDVDVSAGLTTIALDLPERYDVTGQATPGVQYLAGWYHWFKFRQNVRSVFFENTIALLAQPGASVWGMVKIRGAWKPADDWTRDFQKAWCRDDSNEDIEELVVIIGNSDWQNKQTVNPREPMTLKAYPTGCAAWSGTTTTTNIITSTNPDLTITEVAQSTMRFEIDPTFVTPGEPRQYWEVVSGHLSWRVTVTGACTGSAQGSVTIPRGPPGEEMARLTIWEEGGALVYMGNQGPVPGDVPAYTITCPGSSEPPARMTVFIIHGWFGTDEANNKVSLDGKSISGDFTSGQAGGAIKTRYQYSFRVVP